MNLSGRPVDFFSILQIVQERGGETMKTVVTDSVRSASIAYQIQAVERALFEQKYDTAIQVAQAIYAERSSTNHLELLQKALIDGIRAAASENNVADFNRRIQQAEALAPENPAWRVTVGRLHAAGANLARGLAWVQPLNDPNAVRVVLEEAVDTAIQKQSAQSLPSELQSEYEAVITSFRHYEASRDDQARAALDAIGLRSPFLDWKVFLRGLIAFSQNDHTRAIENWKRLNPDRLAWQLASPMRYSIDSAFAESRTDGETLKSQYQALWDEPITIPLSELVAVYNNDKKLRRSFRLAANLLPDLQSISPTLVDKLARCFYAAILQRGEPQDLIHYRRVFPAAPDDPEFHKLLALIQQEVGNANDAAVHWRSYEQWLAKNPPGWTPELIRWCRAIILLKIAAIHEDREDIRKFVCDRTARLSIDEYIPETLRPSRDHHHRKKKSIKNEGKYAIEIYQQAAELVPEWELPPLLALTRLIQSQRWQEAIDVAQKARKHLPGSLMILERLAALHVMQGNYSEALDVQKQLLAKNPLDRELRQNFARNLVTVARQLLLQQRLSEVEQCLLPYEVICQENVADSYYSLRSVIARLQGRQDEAERFRGMAIAHPDHFYSGRYFLAIDAILAKLKPALRKPLEKDLATVLHLPEFTPSSFLQYYRAVSQLSQQNICYRGQSCHLKIAHDALDQVITYPWPYEALESVIEQCLPLAPTTVRKRVLTRLVRYYPRNPLFLLLAAEFLLEFPSSRILEKRWDWYLDFACVCMEFTQEARYERLRPRIDKISVPVNRVPSDREFFFDD